MASTRAAVLGLVAVIAGGEAGAIDLVGVEQATFEWTQSSGPVAGYYVIVSKNGAAPEVVGMSDDTVETVQAAFGDEIVVQVAAFDTEGMAGPVSPASDPVRFLAEASPPAGDPPAPDPVPDPGDPPPPGEEPVGSDVTIDFDGDGHSDILLRNLATSGLTLWAMDGERIRSATPMPPLPTNWELVGIGDTNGDGFPDLVWHEPDTGSVMVWIVVDGASVGGGPLEITGLPEGALATGGGWHVGGCGDVDGDGRDDLIVFSRAQGRTEVLHLDGASVIGQSSFTGNTGTQTLVSTADHDGDGDAELVWQDGMTGELTLWSFEGSDVVATTLGTYADAHVLGAGDYDGDGADDLVLQLPTGAVEAHTAAGGVQALGDTPAGDFQPTTRGDYDGDGRSDMLWANAAAEEIQIWFSTDGGVVPAAASGDVILPDEEVVTGSNGNDAAFLQRLCDGDFNDDGFVGGPDFARFARCMGGPAVDECEPMDMNSDGVVGGPDYALFREVFGGPPCPDGF